LSEGLRLAVVLNHDHFDNGLPRRKGTEADCQSIRATFKALGFLVHIYDDPTFADIQRLINRVQAMTGPNELACLALFVLSHGEEDGVIFARDKPYRLDKTVVQALTPASCPSLAGKPKLIFLQTCQGKEADDGATVKTRQRHTSHDGLNAESKSYVIPQYADFFIFQAAYHGHFSFRSNVSGTWFIQALCAALNASGEVDTFQRVTTRAKRMVSLDKESNAPDTPEIDKKRQIPLVQDLLIRDLYLKRDVIRLSASLENSPTPSRRSTRSLRSKKVKDMCKQM